VVEKRRDGGYNIMVGKEVFGDFKVVIDWWKSNSKRGMEQVRRTFRTQSDSIRLNGSEKA